MRHLLIAIAAIFSFLSAAQACSDYALWSSNTYNLSVDKLYSPQSYDIREGGENYLSKCGFNINETGYFTTTPDFSFGLSKMNGYRLVVSVLSNCDAALLVNRANSQWLYDDDSNGKADPRLELSNLGKGVLEVWVGTYNDGYCDATLTLETF